MGPHTLALQFHIEAQASAIESWLVGHAVELAHANVDLQSLRDRAPVSSPAAGAVLRKWLAGA